MAVTEREQFISLLGLKRKLIAVTVVAVLFLLVPVVLIVVDPMFLIGRFNFRLENGTILHEILKEELECGRFEVYLFNITNAERFVSGEDYKLKLEEIGPFTYIEYRLNKELILKDGVMKYTPKLRSVFVPEHSVADPKDLSITMPNIPMLVKFEALVRPEGEHVSMARWVFFGTDTVCDCGRAAQTMAHLTACSLCPVSCTADDLNRATDDAVVVAKFLAKSATTLMSKSPYFIRELFNMMASQLRSKALVTKSAYDYLWGYHEPLLSFANKLAPGLIHFETTGIMDRMYDKNSYYRLELGATYTDKFSVKAVTQYTVIKAAGQKSITESIVNFTDTDTYEGIAYPPKLNTSKPVNIYRVGICRSFPMTAFGTTTSEYGPDAVIYEMNRAAFRNGTLCNSQGFCPNGLMDMSSCFYGLPLALSKGHFLDGDSQLLDRIEGLNPNRTKHDSRLVIEPKIGLTLETSLSLQVNIALGDLNYSTNARRFSDIVLPIAHFKIKQPRLPEIAIRALTLMYITMPKLLLIVNIMSFILGIVLLGYSLRLMFVLFYCDKFRTNFLDISSVDSKTKVQPLIEK